MTNALIWLNKKWPSFKYVIEKEIYFPNEDMTPNDISNNLIINILASYRIEGIRLDYDELYDRFGSEPSGVISAYLDAYNTDTVLTIERLLGWHSDIMGECKGEHTHSNHGFGGLRKDDVEISDGTRTLYVGIPPDRLPDEIENLIDWVNSDKEQNSLIKAIVAHFWFESIHPFSDGNGRVGRLLMDFILKKSNRISRYILENQNEYYNQFRINQRCSLHDDIDITTFIDWFIRIIRVGLVRDENERKVYELKLSNKRIEKCLIYLLENGMTTISINKYRKLYATTAETARNEIIVVDAFFKNE
jgi:Fic family protein